MTMLSYDVVEWGKPLKKIERATPVPKGAEVLVRLKYCGVCHSDAHIRDGYFDLGGGKRLDMSARGMHLPATLGHEPLGTVIAAGPDAGEIAIGQDRLIYPWTGCGECPRCREGLDNCCMTPRMIGIQRPGGYADHLIVPHPRYLIDASGIDPIWAATLSCSGLSTYSAVSKLKPIPQDEWVAVIGAGGLGLSAIGMLRALGHESIVGVDIAPAKLAAAQSAGAAVTFNSRDSDAASKLKEITRGALYGAVDFVGSTETAQLAFGALRKGGKLILVGLFGGEIPLSIASTILRAITVQGSHLGSVTELKEVVTLAREGTIKTIPIHKRPLAEVSRTLDELKRGEIIGRVAAEI
ncbi:MAG TPA: alcohol dehydrogenase [Candidatus Binatia bacterium]|jgi:D-arabinose 1-dehydrogenase-like Zn-dependent alcohol dehydrogenase